MPLRCSVLTAPSDLEALRAAWSELLGRSAADGPMLSPLWLLAWWRAFGAEGGRRLVVAAFHEGDRLVGLAPFVARTHRHRPAIPFRRIELLGTGEPEEDEVCSEHLGVLAERGREEPVARAFAAALVEGALGPWDELVVGPMDADGPIAPALAAELSRAGVSAELTAAGPSYYVELPATFTAYTARLSPSSRYLLTRSTRDFERWAGAGVALHVAATPAELEAGKQALVALHGERWGGGGAFVSPRFRAFHEGVTAALLARGALELLWLTVRGEPFAAAYDVLWRGRVFYYQSGRRLDVPRNIRPGIVLLGHALRRAIEAGRREYDFLGGDHRYKRELGTSCRTVVSLRAVRDRGGDPGARAGARRGRPRRRARGAGDPGRGEGAGERAPDAGGPPAVLHGDLNMLRCFAGTGVRTVVLSSDPDAPSFFSRHCGQRRLCTSFEADPAAALADLRDLGKLHPGRPVLFYGDDAMLLLVSRHREALRERFRFSLPPADRVEALVDKRRFAALSRELSLPVPRTLASTRDLRASEIAAQIPPPVVLKPFCHLGFRSSEAVLGLGAGPVKALYAGIHRRARAHDRAHQRLLPRVRGAGAHPRGGGARLQLPRLPRRPAAPARALRGEEDPHLPPQRRGEHLPRALRRARARPPGLRRARSARFHRRGQARLQARSAERALLPARGQPALQPVEPPRRRLGRQPPPPRLPRPLGDPGGPRAPRADRPALAGARRRRPHLPPIVRPRRRALAPGLDRLAPGAQGLRRLLLGRRLALGHEPGAARLGRAAPAAP